MNQGALDWLVQLLVDGNKGCEGAHDSRLQADVQHISFKYHCCLSEAKVFGLYHGLCSKTMNGEAER